MKNKLKSTYAAIQELAPLLEEGADVVPLELVRTPQRGRKLLQLLRRADIKKIGIAAGGAVLLLSVVNHVSEYKFYQAVVTRELKKQLAPIRKQLNEMDAALADLTAQQETPEDESKPLPKRHKA